MVEKSNGRGRRRWASAAAVLLALAGVAAAGYALAAQHPAPPAPHDPAGVSNAARPRMPGQPRPASPESPESPTAAVGEYRQPVGPIMDRSAPVRIDIPSLGVSTGIIRLGLQQDGTMEVPRGPGRAGWFDESPAPGTLGPAVIAGHVTWDREPDVFFELGRLRPGQRVEVARRDRSTSVFEVTRVGQYAKEDFPTDLVYGSVDHAALRLITCGGVFDGENDRYLDNVIVFARLVGAGST